MAKYRKGKIEGAGVDKVCKIAVVMRIVGCAMIFLSVWRISCFYQNIDTATVLDYGMRNGDEVLLNMLWESIVGTVLCFGIAEIVDYLHAIYLQDYELLLPREKIIREYADDMYSDEEIVYDETVEDAEQQ